MSALAYPRPNALPLERQKQRPLLELVDSPAVLPATYWRRRFVAAVMFAIVVCLSVYAVDRGLSSVEARLFPQSEGFSQLKGDSMSVGSAPATWVVRPGDTLWSIAKSVRPGGDTASITSQLTSSYGSRSLHPGDVVLVPG